MKDKIVRVVFVIFFMLKLFSLLLIFFLYEIVKGFLLKKPWYKATSAIYKSGKFFLDLVGSEPDMKLHDGVYHCELVIKRKKKYKLFSLK